MSTMRAAVARQLRAPLELEDMPIPTPGPSQVLVRIEATGVCHTDLHAIDGDWPVKPTLPLIPGHEGVGYVAALGAGVTGIREGDAVGIPWLHDACGICEYCRTGWEAGDHAVDEVLKMTEGGAHGVLVTAVSPAAFTQSISCVRRGGTIALVGLPPGDFPTPIFPVVLKRITLRGSIVGTRQDLAEAIAFAAEGKVATKFSVEPLSAVNDVLDRLREGRVEGRVVLKP